MGNGATTNDGSAGASRVVAVSSAIEQWIRKARGLVWTWKSLSQSLLATIM